MIMNIIINPIISFRSDRTRSRLGRRIPYLLFATPFITLSLIFVGYAPKIATWLYGLFFSDSSGISSATLGLILIGLSIVIYRFFELFVAAIYYYLFADVIPEKFMGRFLALFRVVGSASGFFFNYFIFGFAENYMSEVFLFISIIFLVSFLLMCWKVKEGEYPPAEKGEKHKGFVNSFMTYFRECFSKRFYILLFIGAALNQASMVCRNLFNVFFARENIGLDLATYGKIWGIGSLLMTVLFLPAGYLVDKLLPLRVHMAGVIFVIITNIIAFIFVHSTGTFIILVMLLNTAYVIQIASGLPMLVALLPKARFGQFCSAEAMVVSFALIVANFGGGAFIDLMGDYRYIFVWDALFTTVALFCLCAVYREWHKHGGPDNYVAP